LNNIVSHFTLPDPEIVEFACLIHGDGYDWSYVEKLYNMVRANCRRRVRFHVFTEAHRSVPEPMIKHELLDWPGIEGPKKAWWYKMQMFNIQYHRGRMLYMDLDVIIARNIDWIWQLDTNYFWAIHDFRHLWRPGWQGMNSSIMLWDTRRWGHIWENFAKADMAPIVKRYHGDQDYLNTVIPQKYRKFLDPDMVKSWRWQVKDGGMDMRTRLYARPNAGTVLDLTTAVMIFHGSPKPHELDDPLIRDLWK
jgi:hypothetical protein